MSKLIKKAEEFVFDLFKNELDSSFIYHNYTHTERVLRSIREIIENSDIDKKDAEVLELAALLHDTGYINTIEGHEEESVKIATKFLKEQKADDKIIDAVNECIMA
ncbi:MAG: HD domain-containing protein, partial [Bacteroidia bacterium]|nr:HD domain-containing protein [Bacteroidia bacterium]